MAPSALVGVVRIKEVDKNKVGLFGCGLLKVLKNLSKSLFRGAFSKSQKGAWIVLPRGLAVGRESRIKTIDALQGLSRNERSRLVAALPQTLRQEGKCSVAPRRHSKAVIFANAVPIGIQPGEERTVGGKSEGRDGESLAAPLSAVGKRIKEGCWRRPIQEDPSVETQRIRATGVDGDDQHMGPLSALFVPRPADDDACNSDQKNK
jgi:hypothetical protein